MKYLLDAGTVAGMLRGSPVVVLRVRMVDPSDVAIPAPAILELHAAILRVRDAARRRHLAHDVDRLVAFVGVAPLTANAAAAAARQAWRWPARVARLSEADRLNLAIARTSAAVLVSTRALALRSIPGVAVENWQDSDTSAVGITGPWPG